MSQATSNYQPSFLDTIRNLFSPTVSPLPKNSYYEYWGSPRSTVAPSPTPIPQPSVEEYGRNSSIDYRNVSPQVKQAIDTASKTYGVPKHLLYDIGYSESSLNPNPPANPESDASGLFQFTSDTWDTVKNYLNMKGSSLKLPNSDRNDPLTSALAAAYLIKFGQLGRWNASKWNWGKYYTPTELTPYYSQTLDKGGE